MATWADIQQKIDTFVEKYPASSWGPAHIALEDYNLDDDQIRRCITLILGVLSYRAGQLYAIAHSTTEILERMEWYKDYETDELRATKDFLLELLKFPESVRLESHGDWLNEEDETSGAASQDGAA